MGARPKIRGVAPSQVTPSTGGRVAQGAGQEDLAKNPVTPQHRRSASELHIPRSREERGRDSGWCHPREGDPLRAPHLLQDEDPGTGSGRSEGVEGNEAPAGDSPRTGHRP